MKPPVQMPVSSTVVTLQTGVARVVLEDTSKPGVFAVFEVDLNRREIRVVSWEEDDILAASASTPGVMSLGEIVRRWEARDK